jgi:hypothetical protein
MIHGIPVLCVQTRPYILSLYVAQANIVSETMKLQERQFLYQFFVYSGPQCSGNLLYVQQGTSPLGCISSLPPALSLRLVQPPGYEWQMVQWTADGCEGDSGFVNALQVGGVDSYQAPADFFSISGFGF